MSINKDDIDYLNLTLEEIYEKWVEDNPAIADEPTDIVYQAIETAQRLVKEAETT